MVLEEEDLHPRGRRRGDVDEDITPSKQDMETKGTSVGVQVIQVMAEVQSNSSWNPSRILDTTTLGPFIAVS